MISITKFSMVLFAAWLSASMVFAQDSGVQRDARAIEVLTSMSAYTSDLDQFVVKGLMFTDARLAAGLMVSNSVEGEIVIDRSRSSAHIKTFDGVGTKEIYFHEGLVTVYSSEGKLYGQAEIPSDLDAALEFVLEELDIEAPLMDLIYKDAGGQLVDADDAVFYLTDKSRIDGIDCHQIAIRGPEVDIQLWIEEGDQPVLRKIVMTSKWEGGAPRFVSELSWDMAPKVDPEIFEFKAPEGATNIGFINHSTKP